MLGVWRRLAEAAGAGARVVVALLEPHHAAPFLQTAAALRTRGLLQQGDLVFIMAQSPWPFIKDEYVCLAILVMQELTVTFILSSHFIQGHNTCIFTLTFDPYILPSFFLDQASVTPPFHTHTYTISFNLHSLTPSLNTLPTNLLPLQE